MGRQSTLFIYGIPSETRARELAYEFERYGRLVRCDIPAPKAGAPPKRQYAFVEFEDSRDAEDAMRALNGRRFEGSILDIQWAKSSGSAPEFDERDGGRRFDRREEGRRDMDRRSPPRSYRGYSPRRHDERDRFDSRNDRNRFERRDERRNDRDFDDRRERGGGGFRDRRDNPAPFRSSKNYERDQSNSQRAEYKPEISETSHVPVEIPAEWSVQVPASAEWGADGDNSGWGEVSENNANNQSTTVESTAKSEVQEDVKNE